MEKLLLWWDGLVFSQQILAYGAVPASVILILQTILTGFGLIGANGEADASFESDSEFSVDDLPDGVDISDFPDGFDIDGDGIPDIFPGDFAMDHGPIEASKAPTTDISSLITFRGIIAFLAAGGWLGIGLISVGVSEIKAIIISLIVGFVIMIIIGIVLKKIKENDSIGNVKKINTIGLDGEVYLKIPGDMSGTGKVNILVQGRFSEFEAATSWEQDIKTGEKINVVAVTKGGVILVEPKAPPILKKS